jgi:hypothetical protein
MNEQDSMHALLLARISMLEGILMLVLNEHPSKEKIKKDAAFLIEANEIILSNSTVSDQEMAISKMGREQSFHAVFHELENKADGNS